MRNEYDTGIPPWSPALTLLPEERAPSSGVQSITLRRSKPHRLAHTHTRAHIRAHTASHSNTLRLIFHLDGCVIAETTGAVSRTKRLKKNI